ncbi:hypothetical protein B296_00053054 [Ensete ventricosum]|uniref:Uncharacterized protein n=1 Tax=Ensete ventricosum TaxID=4639 RepID=A0A426WVM3_ENSVE|nr:hypothetical protein B296_00053054 [Ensete ventricosum]
MALVPTRGNWLLPGPLQGATARRGSTRKGRHPRARPPAASPQGPEGSADHRGGRPFARQLPATKRSRRLRRGSSGNGVVRVKEG